jgi:hypothetical protein
MNRLGFPRREVGFFVKTVVAIVAHRACAPCCRSLGRARPGGLRALLGLMLLLTTSRGSAGEPKYYECVLQQVLAGGKDMVLLVGTEDGQVSQHGLEVPGEPETACRMKEQHLRVDGARLSGPLVAEIGPHREKIALDVALDAGGTYQVAYGCPEPSRNVQGNVTVEAPKDAKSTKRVVRLEQVFGPDTCLELTLEVDRAAKTLAALPAVSPGYNNGRHPVDIARQKR